LLSSHELGRKIYNFRCYFCHGYSGDAKTLAASFITPSPRDFTQTSPDSLSRIQMIEVVMQGKPDTAMMGFSRVLNEAEILAVVDFVRQEFMTDKKRNTKYHTDENGWPNHQRYRLAFPFALNELSLDTAWEDLTPQQQDGKRLYMSACVTCHDRARVDNEGVIWESRPLSYPRNNYSHKSPRTIDAQSSATPYSIHEIAPDITSLSTEEKLGERLFLQNCAFCHSEDGTGRNWIGSFLQPHPRDLTGKEVYSMTPARLRQVIHDGLPGTTMSAWKSVLNEEQIQAIVKYITRAFINKEEQPATN